MKKLQKKLIAKGFKVLRKTSLKELVLVKLQVSSVLLYCKKTSSKIILEYVPTTSCFKKCFDKKVLIKLQPSNTQPAISAKNGANVGIFMYLQEDLSKEASKSKFLMSICLQNKCFKVHKQVKQMSSSQVSDYYYYHFYYHYNFFLLKF